MGLGLSKSRGSLTAGRAGSLTAGTASVRIEVPAIDSELVRLRATNKEQKEQIVALTAEVTSLKRGLEGSAAPTNASQSATSSRRGSAPVAHHLSDSTSDTPSWKSMRATFSMATALHASLLPDGFELSDFATPERLFRLMGHGEDVLPPVRLLDGEWLISRAAQLRAAESADERRKLALPRRQELFALHPEAYMSPERLASLPRGDARIGHALPLVVVSHSWRTPGHPDPEGDNLLALTEAFAALAAIPNRFPEGSFAVFFDWASLPQADATGQRTPAESAAFRTAIEHMQLWYAHELTLVYLLSTNPPSWGNVPSYEARGWPSFERRVAAFNKRRSKKCWANLVDVGALHARTATGRQLEDDVAASAFTPALLPHVFEVGLRDKAFTSGADRAVVARLYKSTFQTVRLAVQRYNSTCPPFTRVLSHRTALALRLVGVSSSSDALCCRLACPLSSARCVLMLLYTGPRPCAQPAVLWHAVG